MKHFFKLLFLVNILFSSFVWAQGETPEPEAPAPIPKVEMQAEPVQQTPPPTEDYGAAFVKMLVALIALFVIVGLAIWLIKSFSRGRFYRGVASRRLEIIERRALSQKSVLYLLEVDGARVLVSESQHEVRALYTGAIPEEKEEG